MQGKDPENLVELFEIMDNPPYKGMLNQDEQEEMVVGWLHRHSGLFKEAFEIEEIQDEG